MSETTGKAMKGQEYVINFSHALHLAKLPFPQYITLSEEMFEDLEIVGNYYPPIKAKAKTGEKAVFMGVPVIKGEPEDPIRKLQKRVKELEAEVGKLKNPWASPNVTVGGTGKP